MPKMLGHHVTKEWQMLKGSKGTLLATVTVTVTTLHRQTCELPSPLSLQQLKYSL